MFLHASKEDRQWPVGDVRLARAAECIECIAAADSVCFAQTAALRRWGRALSEKRKGHEGVDGDVYQV